MSCFIIGVAGGSGSGKSTVTEHIINSIGLNKVAVVMQDYYYKDFSHLSLEERRLVNLDHPDAFDWELLRKHLSDLSNGIAIDMPIHDFANYVRLPDTQRVVPAQVVVFEGIFAFKDRVIRSLLSLKVFVDTAPDIRFIRRLQRDIKERERTVESVIRQYLEYVRAMHKKFIEPTRRHSNIIIPHGVNKAALEMIISRIYAVLNGQQIIIDSSSIICEDEDE